MRRVFCVIAALFFLLAFGGCDEPPPENENCKSLAMETPISQGYENYPTAKNPWNVKLFDGVLYFATGDYGKNSGNTPIFAYDTESGRWLDPFISSDEALDAFRVIDGRLFAVGNDSTLNGSVGNYYELTEGGWVTHSDLEGAVHVFDVTEHNGTRFFAIGTEDPTVSPVISDNGNGEFSYLRFTKDGENRLLSEDFEFSRVYNLFSVNGELYAFFFAPHLDTSKPHTYEFYKYDGEGFEFISDMEELGIGFVGVYDGEKSKQLRQNFLNCEFARNGYAYFTSGFLYKSSDFESAQKIEIDKGCVVSDILCYNGECYALTFERSFFNIFINTVWHLNDDDTATPITTFSTREAYALSFEFDGDKFYVALGNRADTVNVGKLCIIDAGGD